METKHVHETNPKRTIITVVIFIVIIVAGLLTVSNPHLKYVLSPQQTVELVAWEEDIFLPYELEDIFSGANDTTILVDIRDRFEFGKGHIPGAENISANILLQKDNIRRLKKLEKDGMTIVIYSDDQLKANGPWMVFQQLGFENVKILKINPTRFTFIYHLFIQPFSQPLNRKNLIKCRFGHIIN